MNSQMGDDAAASKVYGPLDGGTADRDILRRLAIPEADLADGVQQRVRRGPLIPETGPGCTRSGLGMGPCAVCQRWD
jgi:hypothetical protein